MSTCITVDFTNPVYFEGSVDRLLDGASKLFRVHAVSSVLDDDDPDKRSEAARILGDLRDPTMLHPLMQRIAKEWDDTVKYWLVVALGDLIELDSREGLNALQLLKDLASIGSPYVRRSVAQAYDKLRARYPTLTLDSPSTP